LVVSIHTHTSTSFSSSFLRVPQCGLQLFNILKFHCRHSIVHNSIIINNVFGLLSSSTLACRPRVSLVLASSAPTLASPHLCTLVLAVPCLRALEPATPRPRTPLVLATRRQCTVTTRGCR
jgi:hypothetical protein